MTVPIDEHNAEAQAVWAAFHAGNPIRPPVYLGTNTQYFIFNDDLNPGEQVTFEAYATDARRCWSFNCGRPSGERSTWPPIVTIPWACPTGSRSRSTCKITTKRPILARRSSSCPTSCAATTCFLIYTTTRTTFISCSISLSKVLLLASGRFVLREGNNVVPHTPAANLTAMYEAARARAS